MQRRKFIQFSALGSFVDGLSPSTVSDQLSTNLVFLFQGDSITDGNRGRSLDPNHIMGHGYVYSIASRIGADFPENGFTFYNRGISGNTISDLKKRWQTDTLDLKPDVLSILIGINDANAQIDNPIEATSIEQFEIIYRELLNDALQLNPNILFVFNLPFVYPGSRVKDKLAIWEEDILKRQAVIRNLATTYNCILVDYNPMFAKVMKKTPIEYWIWDGIHPTVFAHELMARLWIKEVSAKLKFLKSMKV